MKTLSSLPQPPFISSCFSLHFQQEIFIIGFTCSPTHLPLHFCCVIRQECKVIESYQPSMKSYNNNTYTAKVRELEARSAKRRGWTQRCVLPTIAS